MSKSDKILAPQYDHGDHSDADGACHGGEKAIAFYQFRYLNYIRNRATARYFNYNGDMTRIPSLNTSVLYVSLAAVSLLGAASLNAQDAAPVTAVPVTEKGIFTPMTEVQGETKVTIVNARWIPLSQVDYKDTRSGHAPPRAFFAVDYRFEDPNLARAAGSRRVPAGPIVDIISPDGMRLRGSAIGQPQDGVYTRVWNAMYLVDPRWQQVKLEFTWQDPKSPPNANGRFRETVEWTNIPLPTTADQPLKLDLARITPNGTRLWLESSIIQDRYLKPGDRHLYLVGRWLPPVHAPDLCATIETTRGRPGERGYSVEYDTGPPFQDRTHHIGVSPGKSFGRTDTTAGYFTASAAAPPPEAKTVTLRVDVASQAPSLAQAQWTKKFDFTVPLTGLPLPAPETTEGATTPTIGTIAEPIATSALGDARLLLLPPRFSPDRGYKNMWKAEVVLQAPPSATSDREWRTTGIIWYPEPGRNITSTGMNRHSSAWRDDGTLLQPNEKLWYITPFLGNDQPLAAAPKLTFETKWNEVQRSQFDLKFEKLPIPQPGQVLTPDTKFPVGAWGQFVVRKIGYFDEAHTLSPRVASRYTMLQPPYGLAVVLEYVPAANASKVVWGNSLHARTWNIGKASAQDNRGRTLVRLCDVGDGRNEPSTDDLDPSMPVTGTPRPEFSESHATKNGYFFTIYLLPPDSNAQSFDLEMSATVEKILRTQTVVWPDVPLPLPPASSTPAAP